MPGLLQYMPTGHKLIENLEPSQSSPTSGDPRSHIHLLQVVHGSAFSKAFIRLHFDMSAGLELLKTDIKVR